MSVAASMHAQASFVHVVGGFDGKFEGGPVPCTPLPHTCYVGNSRTLTLSVGGLHTMQTKSLPQG